MIQVRTIRCGNTITTTDTIGIQLVAIAITITRWHIIAATTINGTWAVTDTACVDDADTVVHVVADAVAILVRCARTATLAEGVKLVAITVAVACGNARATAHTTFVGHIAVTVAIACWDTRSTAHPAFVEVCASGIVRVIEVAGAHIRAVVSRIVADAIGIVVGRASPTTVSEGVELIAVTVAIACRNGPTAAFINGAKTIAYTALIGEPDAIVDVIANAVPIDVGGAIPTAIADFIRIEALQPGARRVWRVVACGGIETTRVTIGHRVGQ